MIIKIYRMFSQLKRMVFLKNHSLSTYRFATIWFLLLVFNANAELSLPEVHLIDKNGVNIVSGLPIYSIADLTIGNGAMAMGHKIADFSGGVNSYHYGTRYDGFLFGLRAGESGFKLQFDHSETTFRSSDAIGNNYFARSKNGSLLIKNSETSFTFVKSDGKQIVFDYVVDISKLKPSTVIEPNGLITKIHYKAAIFNGFNKVRIQSVTQSNGLQFKFNYSKNYTSTSLSNDIGWYYPTNMIAINNAVEYCNPTADTCVLTNEWATVSYQWTNGNKTLTVIGTDGHKTVVVRENYSTGFIKSISITRDSSPPQTYIYNSNKVVKSTFGTQEWLYRYITEGPFYSGGPTYANNTVEGVDGTLLVNIRSPDFFRQDSMPTSIMDTSFQARTATYDIVEFSNHIETIADYENGNFADHIAYDARGNITEIKTTSSGLSDIIRTADFDLTCNNALKCNQPNYRIDGKGNQTDYTYHAQSGLVLTTTFPANDHGIRPQFRNTYEQKYAWYKNSSGASVRAITPVWLLTKISSCIKGAASGSGCALANDEVVTTYDYGSNSGPNNLFLRGSSVTSQGQTRRTCFAYDNYGNRISGTSPKANLSSCQ